MIQLDSYLISLTVECKEQSVGCQWIQERFLYQIASEYFLFQNKYKVTIFDCRKSASMVLRNGQTNRLAELRGFYSTAAGRKIIQPIQELEEV